MIIDASPAAVQSCPAPLGLGHWLDPMLDSPDPRDRADAFRMLARLDAPTAPVEIDPTDHAEPIGPSREDEDWYLSVVEHADWPRVGELSPEEQEIELEYLDMLNERAELVASWDRYEAGFGW